jgi:hypothetical protein
VTTYLTVGLQVADSCATGPPADGGNFFPASGT